MGSVCNKHNNKLDEMLKENCLDKKIKERESKLKDLKANQNNMFDDNDIVNTNPELQIDISDFSIKRKLGKGSFGQVYLVEHKTSGKEYAMKILIKDKMKENDLVENSKVERIILSKLSFPFIVDLKYSFQSSTKLFLVTEYVSGGDLHDLLKKLKCFKFEMVRFFIAELVVSLNYLHENNCIYRDLKPENILLSSDGHIKLIDFNLSKLFISNNSIEKLKAESICGTADYMAPEIIIQTEYNYLVDWYSLGVITFAFFAGYTPINCRKNPMDVEVKKKPIYFNKDIFSNISEDFIKKLLQFNPKKRLGSKGVDEIKNHAFFEGINWDSVINKEYRPLYIPNTANIRDSVATTKNTIDECFDYPFTNNQNMLVSDDKNLKKGKKGGTYEGFTYINDSDVIIS